MNDPLLMPVMDGTADLAEQFQSFTGGELSILRVFRQRPGVGDVLHHEERDATRIALVHARLVHLGDARMLESRQQLGFELESLNRLGRVEAVLEHLDRDRATWRLLNRLVDRAHATGADDAPDGVLTDRRPDHRVDGQRLMIRGAVSGNRRQIVWIGRIRRNGVWKVVDHATRLADEYPELTPPSSKAFCESRNIVDLLTPTSHERY